jgi:protein involved in polysaccharide export with SLBB domain
MNLLRPVAFFIFCGALLLLSACSNNPESIATEKFRTDLKQSNSYAMFGHIAAQGRYSLASIPSRMTVTKAILRAGGFSSVAHKSHVVLHRGVGKVKQRLIIDVDAIMRQKDPNEDDPTVKAGDVIIVYGRDWISVFGY